LPNARRDLFFSEAEMKLRDDDKKWFTDEIGRQLKEVVESFKPHGWRKAVFVLRELGPLAATAAIVIALLGITLGAVYQSVAHVKEETEFRTNAKNKLEKLDTDVVSLRALISSSQPLKSQNQKAAKELLVQARQKLVPPIPEAVVQQAGMSFIEAAETDPSAWGIALDFLNYRSSLNVFTRTVKTVSVPVGAQTYFDIGPVVAGNPLPKVSHIPIGVAPKDGARFEKIGHDLNQQSQFGTPQLILTGGAVSLDDKYVRHAIFQGVEIHYTGRPLILQDAMFIDCTFILENTQPGRQLGQVLLASLIVNFEKAS
jgi:hypothetical protein